jgi:hypothetical protein
MDQVMTDQREPVAELDKAKITADVLLVTFARHCQSAIEVTGWQAEDVIDCMEAAAVGLRNYLEDRGALH